jgi:hypothetical protein
MLLIKDSRIVNWYICELSGVDCCLHFEHRPFILSVRFAISTVDKIFNIKHYIVLEFVKKITPFIRTKHITSRLKNTVDYRNTSTQNHQNFCTHIFNFLYSLLQIFSNICMILFKYFNFTNMRTSY